MSGEDLRVRTAAPEELREPLALIEAALRDGEPLPEGFVRSLGAAVERGELSVVVAYVPEAGVPEDRPVGVLTLAFRPSLALGGAFASIEDLYVQPEFRKVGVGEALVEEAGKLCSARGVSYLEAQVEVGPEGAVGFYGALGFEAEEGVVVMSRSLALGEREEL